MLFVSWCHVSADNTHSIWDVRSSENHSVHKEPTTFAYRTWLISSFSSSVFGQQSLQSLKYTAKDTFTGLQLSMSKVSKTLLRYFFYDKNTKPLLLFWMISIANIFFAFLRSFMLKAVLRSFFKASISALSSQAMIRVSQMVIIGLRESLRLIKRSSN